MMRKVRVEEAGDSELPSGSTIDIVEFLDAEAAVQARIDAGRRTRWVRAAPAHLHPSYGYHQGVSGYRVLPVCSILPGRPPRS